MKSLATFVIEQSEEFKLGSTFAGNTGKEKIVYVGKHGFVTMSTKEKTNKYRHYGFDKRFYQADSQLDYLKKLAEMPA